MCDGNALQLAAGECAYRLGEKVFEFERLDELRVVFFDGLGEHVHDERISFAFEVLGFVRNGEFFVNASRVGFDDAGKDFDEGCFSDAVLADDANDLSLVQSARGGIERERAEFF